MEHVADAPVPESVHFTIGDCEVKVTSPVGVVGFVVVSVTVTVHFEPWLTTTVLGLQETSAVVVSSVTGVTLTVTALEVTATGVPALSVTCSSNIQAPVDVRVPVNVDAGDVQDEVLPRLLKLVAPGASCSHWQV